MTFEEAKIELEKIGFKRTYESTSYVTFTYTYKDRCYINLDLALDSTYYTFIRLFDKNDRQISDDVDFYDPDESDCTLEESYEKAIEYLCED